MPDKELYVAGWGRTRSDERFIGGLKRIGAHSNIMKKLKVPDVPIDRCRGDYDLFKNILPTRHLCAGGEIGMIIACCYWYSLLCWIINFGIWSQQSMLIIFILPGKDSCSGDSGGPLIARNGAEYPMFLRGIVSFGARKCGENGIPGVYINVASYLDWISTNMKP